MTDAEIEAGARALAHLAGYVVTDRVPSMVDDRQFARVAQFVEQARAVLTAVEACRA